MHYKFKDTEKNVGTIVIYRLYGIVVYSSLIDLGNFFYVKI